MLDLSQLNSLTTSELTKLRTDVSWLLFSRTWWIYVVVTVGVVVFIVLINFIKSVVSSTRKGPIKFLNIVLIVLLLMCSITIIQLIRFLV